MNNIILSISIPVYNEEAFLASVLDKVIAQVSAKFAEDVEILISDNCSNDATPEICKDFQRRFPKIVRYVRNERNLGVERNVIRCIDEAKGTYVHFLGGQDSYKEDGLSRIVSICKGNRYDLIFAANDWIWPNGVCTKGFDLLPKGEMLHSRTQFIKHGMIRTWEISRVIVKKSALSSYVMTAIPNWPQLDMSLYVMSCPNCSAYVMPDAEPCVSIRAGDSKWLGTDKCRSMFLDNFKTILGSSRFGYSPKEVKAMIGVYAKSLPRVREIYGDRFAVRIKTAIAYYKQGGWCALPVIWQVLKHPFRRFPETFQRSPVTPEDVEVIVITYNRSEMLQDALTAIVNQTVRICHVTVVDNGSTDDTEAVVRRFSQEHPAVHYCSTGVHYTDNVHSFRFSQKMASKKYCAVFHDDDIVHPQFMEYAIRAINSFDDVVLVSGEMERLYNPSNNDMKVQPFRPLAWRGGDAVVNQIIYQLMVFPCSVYRTDVYKTVGFDSERYGKTFDYPFLLEVSSKGSAVFLRGSFIRYRIHRGSDTNNAPGSYTAEHVLNVVRRVKELLPTEKLSVKAVALYILHKCAKDLLLWGGGRCDPLQLLRDGGVISRGECKMFKNKMYRRAVKHIVKHMKKRILRGKWK